MPLRAQKRARTRIALIEALMPQLAERPLDEVQIGELAKAAGISQATFFNYFPTKGDLLTHFIQLWSLRVAVVARQTLVEHDDALAAIEALFVSTAVDSAAAPNVMLEIIAHQARMPANLDVQPIELAERLLFLPDEPDVMALSDQGLGGLLPEWIGLAVSRGELPASTDVMSLTLAAASVFFGVPLVVGRRSPEQIGALYRQQLQLLWAGARNPEAP